MPGGLKDEIPAAIERLRGVAIATPLVRLDVDDAPAEIYLKLECLQPSGSFKIRTAGNQVLALTGAQRAQGIYTASGGNLGIATAFLAREHGLQATVLVPDDLPAAKLAMLEALGAEVLRLAFADWWQVVLQRGLPGRAETYIDADGPGALAGAATLGLEIHEQLPDADAVLAAWGGGALACGLASVIKAARPRAKMIACELETAQPLTAALAAGAPVEVPYSGSFVSGMGSTEVLPSVWPLARELIDTTAVVSLKAVCDAIRIVLDTNGVVAEGAGAVPVAAALAGQGGKGKLVCVVSGGNLGDQALASIKAGTIPD